MRAIAVFLMIVLSSQPVSAADLALNNLYFCLRLGIEKYARKTCIPSSLLAPPVIGSCVKEMETYRESVQSKIGFTSGNKVVENMRPKISDWVDRKVLDIRIKENLCR